MGTTRGAPASVELTVTDKRFQNLMGKGKYDYVTLLPYGWRTKAIDDFYAKMATIANHYLSIDLTPGSIIYHRTD